MNNIQCYLGRQRIFYFKLAHSRRIVTALLTSRRLVFRNVVWPVWQITINHDRQTYAWCHTTVCLVWPWHYESWYSSPLHCSWVRLTGVCVRVLFIAAESDLGSWCPSPLHCSWVTYESSCSSLFTSAESDLRELVFESRNAKEDWNAPHGNARTRSGHYCHFLRCRHPSRVSETFVKSKNQITCVPHWI